MPQVVWSRFDTRGCHSLTGKALNYFYYDVLWSQFDTQEALVTLDALPNKLCVTCIVLYCAMRSDIFVIIYFDLNVVLQLFFDQNRCGTHSQMVYC